jgi:hypothetical protein
MEPTPPPTLMGVVGGLVEVAWQLPKELPGPFGKGLTAELLRELCDRKRGAETAPQTIITRNAGIREMFANRGLKELLGEFAVAIPIYCGLHEGYWRQRGCPRSFPAPSFSRALHKYLDMVARPVQQEQPWQEQEQEQEQPSLSSLSPIGDLSGTCLELERVSRQKSWLWIARSAGAGEGEGPPFCLVLCVTVISEYSCADRGVVDGWLLDHGELRPLWQHGPNFTEYEWRSSYDKEDYADHRLHRQLLITRGFDAKTAYDAYRANDVPLLEILEALISIATNFW